MLDLEYKSGDGSRYAVSIENKLGYIREAQAGESASIDLQHYTSNTGNRVDLLFLFFMSDYSKRCESVFAGQHSLGVHSRACTLALSRAARPPQKD